MALELCLVVSDCTNISGYRVCTWILSPLGGKVHYGPGADVQEEEGHCILHKRKKLHISSDQQTLPVY